MDSWRNQIQLSYLITKYILVNYYLEKGFFIIKNNSNQLSSVPNDAKLIIHAIGQQKTDIVMVKTTAISSVASTIKKFHIKSYFHLVYKQYLYHDKEK